MCIKREYVARKRGRRCAWLNSRITTDKKAIFLSILSHIFLPSNKKKYERRLAAWWPCHNKRGFTRRRSEWALLTGTRSVRGEWEWGELDAGSEESKLVGVQLASQPNLTKRHNYASVATVHDYPCALKMHFKPLPFGVIIYGSK